MPALEVLGHVRRGNAAANTGCQVCEGGYCCQVLIGCTRNTLLNDAIRFPEARSRAPTRS